MLKPGIHLLILLLLCPAIVLASEGGGFFTPESLTESPLNLDRAVKATAFLKTDVEYGANCSSVILSNDGYVATNIHCLRLCLEKVWGMHDPQLEQISFMKEGFFNGTFFPDRVPSQLRCPKYAMDAYELKRYGLKDPQVIWMGRGRHTHNQEKVTELSQDEFSMFKDLTEDVAILKFEGSNSASCLPVSPRVPQAGSQVWLLGYPADTRRGSKFSRLSVSYGRVRQSVFEDPIYQSQANNLQESVRSLFWEREERVWDRPHILSSSADAYSGSSGGPLVDAHGELVGIVFALSSLSSGEYQGASSYAVRANHLVNQLTEDLGAIKAAEIFRCDPSL